MIDILEGSSTPRVENTRGCLHRVDGTVSASLAAESETPRSAVVAD